MQIIRAESLLQSGLASTPFMPELFLQHTPDRNIHLFGRKGLEKVQKGHSSHHAALIVGEVAADLVSVEA